VQKVMILPINNDHFFVIIMILFLSIFSHLQHLSNEYMNIHVKKLKMVGFKKFMILSSD